MNQPPARRPQRVVGHFPDAVVAEVPPLAGLDADHLVAPQLVESSDDRGFLEVADIGEHVEREVPADGGSDLRHLPRVLGQVGEPRRHDGLDPGRPYGAARAGLLAPSLLDDEQRVAFGLLEETASRLSVERPAGDVFREPYRCGLVQASQHDAGQPLETLHLVHERAEGAVLLIFTCPECGHDQAAERRVGAEEVVQPFQRVGVRPLEVVRHEDQRGRLLKGVRERVEEGDPLPGLRLGSAAARLARIGISSGHSRATSRSRTGSSDVTEGATASLCNQAEIGA